MAVQAPALILTEDGWAQGTQGPPGANQGCRLPARPSYLIPRSSNPHSHSGLLGAQPCFRVPNVHQKLTKTDGERAGEGFPVGIEEGAKIFLVHQGERGKGGEEVTGLALKELVWIRCSGKERVCWLSSPLLAPVLKREK